MPITFETSSPDERSFTMSFKVFNLSVSYCNLQKALLIIDVAGFGNYNSTLNGGNKSYFRQMEFLLTTLDEIHPKWPEPSGALRDVPKIGAWRNAEARIFFLNLYMKFSRKYLHRSGAMQQIVACSEIKWIKIAGGQSTDCVEEELQPIFIRKHNLTYVLHMRVDVSGGRL